MPAAQPEARLAQVISLASIGALEIVSLSAAVLSVSEHRGMRWMILWSAAALLMPLLTFVLACSRHRGLQRWAVDLPRVSRSTGPVLFSDSSIGGPITSWRDWKPAHQTGEGAYFVGDGGVQIFWRRDSSVRAIACGQIEAVEVVRCKAVPSIACSLRIATAICCSVGSARHIGILRFGCEVALFVRLRDRGCLTERVSPMQNRALRGERPSQF